MSAQIIPFRRTQDRGIPASKRSVEDPCVQRDEFDARFHDFLVKRGICFCKAHRHKALTIQPPRQLAQLARHLLRAFEVRVVKRKSKAVTDNPESPTGKIAAIDIAFTEAERRIADENRLVTAELLVQRLRPGAQANHLGGLAPPWREIDAPVIYAWPKHTELGELSACAAVLPLNSARAATGKSDGDAPADTKKTAAAKSKNRAIVRFRALIATAGHEAPEAIAKMAAEEWSKSVLYRYLKDEIRALGRGRKDLSRKNCKRKHQ